MQHGNITPPHLSLAFVLAFNLALALSFYFTRTFSFFFAIRYVHFVFIPRCYCFDIRSNICCYLSLFALTLVCYVLYPGIEQKKEAVGRLETKRKALEEASKPEPPSKAGKGKAADKSKGSDKEKAKGSDKGKGSEKDNKGAKKGTEASEPVTKKARKR